MVVILGAGRKALVGCELAHSSTPSEREALSGAVLESATLRVKAGASFILRSIATDFPSGRRGRIEVAATEFQVKKGKKRAMSLEAISARNSTLANHCAERSWLLGLDLNQQPSG